MAVSSCPLGRRSAFLRGRGGGHMQRPMPPAAVSTVRFLSLLLVCSNSAPLVLSQPDACLQ